MSACTPFRYNLTMAHTCTATLLLYDSIARDDIPAIKTLLDGKQAPINVQDTSGYTPLHYAVKLQHLDAAALILKYSPDVNFRCSYDIGYATPLITAAALNNTKLVLMLLELDAMVNATDKRGKTALHFASQWCNTEAIEALVDYGVDVSVRDDFGFTAAYYGGQVKGGSKITTADVRPYRLEYLKENPIVDRRKKKRRAARKSK